jgi:hypothetical protein
VAPDRPPHSGESDCGTRCGSARGLAEPRSGLRASREDGRLRPPAAGAGGSRRPPPLTLSEGDRRRLLFRGLDGRARLKTLPAGRSRPVPGIRHGVNPRAVAGGAAPHDRGTRRFPGRAVGGVAPEKDASRPAKASAIGKLSTRGYSKDPPWSPGGGAGGFRGRGGSVVVCPGRGDVTRSRPGVRAHLGGRDDRDQEGGDRRASAMDRMAAVQDRQASARDREGAAHERSQRADERAAVAHERCADSWTNRTSRPGPRERELDRSSARSPRASACARGGDDRAGQPLSERR